MTAMENKKTTRDFDSDVDCARCYKPIPEVECYEFTDENAEPICGDCFFSDDNCVDEVMNDAKQSSGGARP